MAYNEDSSASGHDEPWIQWYDIENEWRKIDEASSDWAYERTFSTESLTFFFSTWHLDGSPSSFRFCGLKGHEMFCEVERSYIEDGFNLYGLRTCVSNFSDCLDLILDRIGPDDSDDSHLTQSACTLYGLIHARYIITAHGLDAMYNKVGRMSWSVLAWSDFAKSLLDGLFSQHRFIYSTPQRNLGHVL